MIVTHQLITQAFLVPDITTKLLTYNRMRWYRSSSSRTGLYEPVSANIAGPAELRAEPLTRALNGKGLSLRVNGTTLYTTTIASPDPVELADLVTELDTAFPLLNVTADGDELVLTTVLTGTAASIEIETGDAVPYLGFAEGEGAAGVEADSVLQAGVSEYRLADHQGSTKAWYMVEFRHSDAAELSPTSAPFPSRPAVSVPRDQLIGCYVRLADLQGKPLPGRKLIVHNVFLPNLVEAEGLSWGLFRQYEETVTDENGYAELWLMRGATVDVTIAGTGFTRRVALPTVGTAVDLLGAAAGVDDEFEIQTTKIDFAIRTS